MNSHGTVPIGFPVNGFFSTHDSTGANVAPSDAFESADVVVYEANSTTQITAGITVTSPFDTEVGFHQYRIDTSNAAYFRNKSYTVVLQPDTETVDGATITSIPIGLFNTYEATPAGGFMTVIGTWTSNTNFTLEDGPAADDTLNGWTLTVRSRAGNESHEFIVMTVDDYVGSTKTVTSTVTHGTFTAADDDIVVGVPPRQIYDAVQTIAANTVQVSGDTAAADNLEAAYDGTGYAGGTIKQGVDIVAISGDTVAADNLESYTDGTTPMPVNMTQISGDGPAADNLELAFDGTGYAGGTTKQQVEVVTMATDVITAASLQAAAVTEITDDIMAEVIESEGSYTVQQALSIILAVLAGETSSGGTTISTPNGNATRVAATTDVSNNRTAMTLTPSS